MPLEKHMLDWLLAIKMININPLTVREVEDHMRQHWGLSQHDVHELLDDLKIADAINIDTHSNEDDIYEDDNEITIATGGDISHAQQVLASAENGQLKDLLFHFFNLQNDQHEHAFRLLIEEDHVDYAWRILSTCLETIVMLEQEKET